MNREIKFRGQNIKGEWHYGLLSHNKDVDSDYEWFISNKAGKPFAFGAIEKSIGQFTGLYDKNGKEIYEGDIVKHFNHNEIIREIIFMKGSFGYWTGKEFISYASNYHFEWNDFYKSEKIEIIGNIYENPELLKSGGENKNFV